MFLPPKSTKSTEAKEVSNFAALLRSLRSLAAIPNLKSAIWHFKSGGFAEVKRQEVDQAIAVAEKVLEWARQRIVPSNTAST